MNSLELQLNQLLKKQLNSFFNYDENDDLRISNSLIQAIARTISCSEKVANKYYSTFNPYHSGQYASFLYFIGNEIFLQVGRNETSDKIYYLNKTMHSLDLYYEVKLPPTFYWEHPVGTVLGRGNYGNFFTIYQNCTVGGSWNQSGEIQYPTIGENVTMFSYSCILGDTRIGDNSIISSHCYLLNKQIPPNSVVFGQGKEIIIKPNNKKLSFFKNS